MSRPPELDRNQDATCYVGNLDDRATDALVWELMLQAGPIVNIHLPKDRITQTHQGYGFAEFQTEEDADYACKVLNGIKLFGKPLRINKASSDKKQIDIGANLFVGNLDANVDERTLYETFSTFGAVVGLPKVARDPTTGVSKNFGFVSYDSFEAADAAIESLNNQFLLNRPITVSYAIKKDSKTGERHGTPAERLLAAQARKNNALPQRGPPPPMWGMPAPPGMGWNRQQPGAAPAGVPPLLPPQGFAPQPLGATALPQQQQSAAASTTPTTPSLPTAPPSAQPHLPPPPPQLVPTASSAPIASTPIYAGPPPIMNGAGLGAPLPPQAQPYMGGSTLPPPPPPMGIHPMGMGYGGPPLQGYPPQQGYYAQPPAGPKYMTGANNAPLGPRKG
ncbi:RNA-binding domain-containing protein [Violaceomyces palustris]|uniref:RNA-binding domain-containing protein n=1 Tax=Violaceomyces palustris TaxID=1673888 RepID=A0ACD0NMC3_9BASI|nr:RNA-binding domain-containing protein [Violaceomyces palustris]